MAVPDLGLYQQETGAFRKILPDVFEGKTHYKRALRSLAGVSYDQTMKNLRNRHRKFAAQSLDVLMKALTVPLTNVIKGYPKTLKELHPFEATVANLTVIARVKSGYPHLYDILSKVATLRKETSLLSKQYASEANRAHSIKEALQILETGKDELRALFETSSSSKCLSDLYEMQKILRRIPVIELETPTVVLVGSPNVGKSSLVRKLSTGTPEVNDYPFTTRGVTVGHIIDDRGLVPFRMQVMDTPGLLDRPENLRNEMEKLTYASMAHLPTAVIFVIDPTGLAGEKSSLEAQLNVRKHLRQRFPKRPWLDVVSKVNILTSLYAAVTKC